MQALDTGLFDYFLKSNQGQELTRQRQEERLNKRKESVTAIQELRADQHKSVKKLISFVDEARAKVERQRKSLEKAERDYQEAQRIRRVKANEYELQINNHERYLKESADPMITGFILELRDMADRLMNKEIEVSKRPGKRNPITMQREDEVFSDIEQVKATLSAIRESIHQAEALKLMAIENVEDELQAIRQKIPGIKGMLSSVA